ncbi:hypothetical protein AB6A40_009469 [Gnathostoma spinigerum]|uniref:Uncharacterized protein n=1 Tax=Gnathostoma spinigerum TaxID=75299 RepID=A0ABD6ES19_9BILA
MLEVREVHGLRQENNFKTASEMDMAMVGGRGRQRTQLLQGSLCSKKIKLSFFYPVRPVNIEILREYGSGRSSGEAIAEFGSPEERMDALRRDRKEMGNRYIELFPED